MTRKRRDRIGDSMRVLFVCENNIGRSQVAQACFDKLSRHEGDSAGVGVDAQVASRNLPNRKVKHGSSRRSVAYIKKEFGLDISEKDRQQLAPDVIDRADMVIVIVGKHLWPDYLKEKEGGKVVFWDIVDTVGVDDVIAADTFIVVHRRVEGLVEEIG
jgi:protein-tyrosine-phosphatase